MPTSKAAGVNLPPDESCPATPPNRNTGVSYAQAAVQPPTSTARHTTPSAEPAIKAQSPRMSSSPSQSYASAVEKPQPPPEERRHRSSRAERKTSTDSEALQEQDKAERRKKRREREERERTEWERYETEKHRRREERRARNERERERHASDVSGASSPAVPSSPQVSKKELHKPTKIREDSASEGKHEGDEKPALVSAVQNGIRCAPLNVPLPRRLQTAAVLWHTLSMSICFSIFWFALAIPFTWPVLVPYLIYIFFFANSHADGSSPYRRSEFMRNLTLWRLYTEYFPMRLHRTAELDPNKNYIFAYHPHGIIGHGAWGNFVTEATGFKHLFPGITNTLLTLDANFQIPFNREYLLAMGLASVSKKSCEALLRGEYLKKQLLQKQRNITQPTTWFGRRRHQHVVPEGGRAITIVVGGARESLEAQPGTMRLVVRKRKGFLKLAIRERAGVVPVLSFGENDLYEQVVPGEGSWAHRMQMAVKKAFGFTIPLIHARGVFNYDVGLMPYRHEVNTVVGAPIFPLKPCAGEPTDEEVAEFQKRYIEELMKLWDEWKDVFAKDRRPGPEGELQIIE
ncbi:diacylglycerol O-acyltransferas-like protein 2B [Sphaerosporella brunnea]|uniref:diacylglycerol O-acyltransferase n=1 Tax=Sphaerosporella brunnea TaxID=1250544 RepID=A0A5J5EKS8_9PEZI|nr:diacylglycerol O-acyltransferas-like protein 2B [Sphaerosporella brunnea]KAA8895770.1 diacylglycerol O-acyltransferas-like protein 2B [Sphaerosporella brunnea]